ncbi:integrase, partial [Providencia rettgeri]
YFRKYHPDFKHFTARDLRRTCKTLMGEIGISKEIRDRIQNHALNDVSSKHYDRYDYLNEKRVALTKWEEKLNLFGNISE